MNSASVPPAEPPPVRGWLQLAAAWRFASLAFQPPTATSHNSMNQLVPELIDSLRPAAALVAAFPLDEWEPEYFSVLGPAGCPACESSYEPAAIASRGPLLAEVAGFYEAFAYLPVDVREVPDHVSMELGFLSFLALKVAFAQFEGRADEERVALEAYKGFLRAHVEPWLGELCQALANSGSSQYGAIATFVRAAASCDRPLTLLTHIAPRHEVQSVENHGLEVGEEPS